MAFKLGGDDRDIEEVHEINVTPFIDVMLVLLIIFMVAAPLSTVDVPVDLPSSNSTPVTRQEKPVFVTIRIDQGLSVGETPVTAADLQSELLRATEGAVGKRVYLRADKSLPYGTVMSLLNTLRTMGFTKIALVTLDKPTGP